MAGPFSIPSNNVSVIHFLCVLVSICWLYYYFLNFSQSVMSVVIVHCGLNLHFPDGWYVCWTLFLYFLVIFVSSLGKCWFLSVRRFGFLLLRFENSSYILDTNPLSEMCFAYIFSQPIACLFTEQKLSVWRKYNLPTFSCMDNALVWSVRILCPDHDIKHFLLFSSVFLVFFYI